MPEPITGGLAPNLVLKGGYIVRVTALDPATGATNTDVIVSDVALQIATVEPAATYPKIPGLPPVVTYGPKAANA